MRTHGKAFWAAAGTLGSVVVGGAALAHTASLSQGPSDHETESVDDSGAGASTVVPLHLSTASVRSVYTVSSVSETVAPVTANESAQPEGTDDVVSVSVVKDDDTGGASGGSGDDDGSTRGGQAAGGESVDDSPTVATPVTPVSTQTPVTTVTPVTVVSPQETASPVTPPTAPSPAEPAESKTVEPQTSSDDSTPSAPTPPSAPSAS